MHGFCTVGVFIGILCMGWNYFEIGKSINDMYWKKVAQERKKEK